MSFNQFMTVCDMTFAYYTVKEVVLVDLKNDNRIQMLFIEVTSFVDTLI